MCSWLLIANLCTTIQQYRRAFLYQKYICVQKKQSTCSESQMAENTQLLSFSSEQSNPTFQKLCRMVWLTILHIHSPALLVTLEQRNSQPQQRNILLENRELVRSCLEDIKKNPLIWFIANGKTYFLNYFSACIHQGTCPTDSVNINEQEKARSLGSHLDTP